MWHNHFAWSPVSPISGHQQYLSIYWSLTHDHKFLFIQESPCFVVVLTQVTRSPPGKCPAMVSEFIHQHLSRHTKYCAGASHLCSTSYFLSLYRPQNSLSGVTLSSFTLSPVSFGGRVVANLVEALRYKPEGRGFDSRWCHWNLSLT